MKIYLLRHGQTDWNKKFLIQGRVDNPLNIEGKQEAHNVSKYFHNVDPTMLICSSLCRAQQTLEIIKHNCNWNLGILENDYFIERNFGELEGSDAKAYREIKDFAIYSSYERDDEIQARVRLGIENIISYSKEDEEVVVVCHSHTMKAFLCEFFPDEFNYSFRLNNCAIIEVFVEQGKVVDKKIV